MREETATDVKRKGSERMGAPSEKLMEKGTFAQERKRESAKLASLFPFSSTFPSAPRRSRENFTPLPVSGKMRNNFRSGLLTSFPFSPTLPFSFPSLFITPSS